MNFPFGNGPSKLSDRAGLLHGIFWYTDGFGMRLMNGGLTRHAGIQRCSYHAIDMGKPDLLRYEFSCLGYFLCLASAKYLTRCWRAEGSRHIFISALAHCQLEIVRVLLVKTILVLGCVTWQGSWE